jgi:hypothetical protein
MMKDTTRLIAEMDAQIRSDKAKAWILQASPRIYRLFDALRDERIGNDDVWKVTRYKNEILSGHIGLIWMAGKEAGIYALARITSNPKLLVDSPASTSHWVLEKDKSQEKLRVKIKYVLRFVDNPLKKIQLKGTIGLEDLSIMKWWRATNFRVKKDEWFIISNLIKEKLEMR